LSSLASGPVGERTITGLSVLLQSSALKQALQPYTVAGPWGTLLDEESRYLNFESRRIPILVEKLCAKTLLFADLVVCRYEANPSIVSHAHPKNATVAKLPSVARIDSLTFAPPESQDFRDIQPRDRGGGRFILKISVTSCRSSADEIATFSHFPSGYVRASS
jgi:hypothetical protein